jgi:cytochrome c oxidase subunit 2
VTAWRARLARLGAGLVAAALLLAACGDDRQDVFTPEGETSDKINDLQVPVFIAAGVVGVIVAVIVIYTLVKFRRRDGDDDTPEPVQVHGNFKLEIGWTIAPALILVFVAIGTVATLFDISDTPDDAMHVEVYGQQWWWSYEYDLDDDGTPEIVTANDLVIPAGEDIVLELRSRDVIHSFWIPALTGTRDVVPNRVHELVVQADNPGVFDGQCKEFCGLSHANMKARVVALSPAEFDTWLEQQQEPAAEPDDELAQAGLEQFEALCAQCHAINGVNDEREGDAALVSKHAPNLTHLMSRGVFAGALFDLYDENGELNRTDLEAWLRDPPGMKPMAPDDARGMPNLNLTEEQIDQLVAYLETLGPPNPGPETP